MTASTLPTKHRGPDRRIWTRDNIAINALGIAFIGLFALACLIPFYLIVIASFTPEASLIRDGYPIIPHSFDLQSYALCIKNPTSVLLAYANTIGVTLIGTIMSILLCTMTGYVLSRKDFPYRNQFSFFFFFTTLFNGGLVPWYIICTRYLSMKNSYLGLILPLMFSVWNMIIAKSFIGGIPSAIIESAKIDGANDFTIYIKLIMPLSKPLIATLGLFSALAYWNDWYNCMLYVTNENMFTLQYYLQRMLGSAQALKLVAEKSGIALPSVPLEGMKMAMTIIATGPIVLLYPFVQRYFVKGLTIGAVKG
ncbi:MAG: carbohydrate ABC transporter permease [Eubacteriales bacterium]|nr:carbohydrate ABC transporter permease [Eubacteriales bacterium]